MSWNERSSGCFRNCALLLAAPFAFDMALAHLFCLVMGAADCRLNPPLRCDLMPDLLLVLILYS